MNRDNESGETRGAQPLWAAGFGVCAFLLSVAFLSGSFDYGGAMKERPIVLMVALYMGAGLCYFLGMVWLGRGALPALCWRRVFALGLLCRLFFMGSVPICETDFYRYLWDGGVTAHGFNPYRFPPSAALGEGWMGEDPPTGMVDLAHESGVVAERVNHPELSTVYPPVAQAFFALAYTIQPWSMAALRGVLLAVDALTFFLILGLLRSLGVPWVWGLAYWWNPLLIKESFNSMHMDALILPFVVGAVWAAVEKRPRLAVLLLALATGVKVWPLLLLPLLLRPWLRQWKTLLPSVALYAVFTGLLAALPVWTISQVKASGFVAYGQRWEMNDALFMVFQWLVGKGIAFSSLEPSLTTQRLMVRGVVGLVLGAIVLALCWRSWEKDGSIGARVLGVVAALFLLSPAQFPWYGIWLLPWLCISPRPSLLLLTVLLPMYYLRFYYRAYDNVAFFDNGWVWVEFAPVWLLLAWEAIADYRGKHA
jgi:alpha-1,6-mannosyltransferase